jgi:hypothetical protein
LKAEGETIAGDASLASFGFSVALYAHATTLAIGAPYHNNNAGYVKSIVQTMMANTGYSSARPSTAMPVVIFSDCL